MIDMPDGVHCSACDQDLSILRLGDVVTHGHHTTMVLCWEHVRYDDAPAHPRDRPCTDACSVGIVSAPLPKRELKLVSIVTPTWQRHELLMEAIANVRAQTYRPLEHVIVSDGPDRDLAQLIHWNDREEGYRRFSEDGMSLDSYVPIRFVELGVHWTSELEDSYSAAPMMVAQLVARGEYQMWLADDERAAPFYVDLMVKALETTAADFAYPRVAYYGWQAPETALGIGCSPPVKGGITTAIYRRSLIDKGKGPYRSHVGRGGDWDQISRWMANGATHVFVDRVLFSHRDDRDCPPELYTAPIPEFANA